MNRRAAILGIVLLQSLSSISGLAHDIIKTLNVGAIADTSLFEAAPDNNLGGSPTLVSGSTAQLKRSRALIRFAPDFSLLPTNAVIAGISLQLTVVSLPGGGGAGSNFKLHRLLRPWAEGTKTGNNGGPAASGETTWNAASFPAGLWSSPGAAAGIDYAAVPSTVASVSGLGKYEWSSTDQMIADFKGWREEPAKNFGWILISDAENISQSARRFGDRTDNDNAPLLVIEYLLPPEELKISEGQMIEQYFLLHIEFDENTTYEVQMREDLAPGSPWVTLETLGPFTQPIHWVFADPRGNHPQRFYRLKALP